MKQTIRWAVLMFLGVATAGGVAKAQVAVSSIVPTATRIGDPVFSRPSVSFVPPNPAAMQWGEPTRWGGGTISAERDLATPDPSVETKVAFSGVYLGGVYYGKAVTFGGAYLDLKDQTSPYLLEADWSMITGAVSFQSGELVSFGASIERTGTTQAYNSINYATNRLGISVRFSPTWYAGLVMGTENVTSSYQDPGDRSLQIYGVGYRGKGNQHLHFEAYLIDNKEAQAYSGSNEFSDSSTKVVSGEWQIGNFVLSASVAATEKPLAEISTSTTAFDLGWAPKKGLSLMFHSESTTSKDVDYQGVQADYATSATSISLAFAY